MRDLILAHRDQSCPVDQDVGTLEQGITEEAVGREVALAQPLLLILEARHALQPAERSHHGEQQVQLRVLVHPRLDEQIRVAGVDARREPVDDHVPDAFPDDAGLFIVGGQCMPVRDEEEALVLVLQPCPVAQHAVVVPEMQPAGRTHPREDTLVLARDGVHVHVVLRKAGDGDARTRIVESRPRWRDTGTGSHRTDSRLPIRAPGSGRRIPGSRNSPMRGGGSPL